MLRRIILVLLFFVANSTKAQTWDFNSTEFQIGDILRASGIYYDLGKWNLREESFPLIDSIAEFLKNNKNLAIEIGTHRYSRGSDSYSICISCKRSKSIKEYLVSKGILRARVVSKGYGESQLLVSDSIIASIPSEMDKENAHQKNRRTEFKILATDFVQPEWGFLSNEFTLDAIYHVQYGLYFDFDKWTIRKESQPFLDSLVQFLNTNTNLCIEVGNHRDTRGASEYSFRADKKRAEEVVNNLKNKGISSARLTAKGYGETRPIVSDKEIQHLKTEEEKYNAHQRNRRTELKITSLNYREPSFNLTSIDLVKGDKYQPNSKLQWKLGQWEIESNMISVLDSVTSFMVMNPKIRLEVGSHLDTRDGNIALTYSLSYKRSKAIVEYLVNNGIEEKRLSAHGYGKSSPLISEVDIVLIKSTEKQIEAHDKNLRTEFTIISTTFGE